MSFAPLFFLRGHQPTRRSSWDQDPLMLPDSAERSIKVGFELRRGLFLSNHFFPPYDAQKHQAAKAATASATTSLYHPPPHYHLFNDEHFLVTQGAGTWHLWDRDVRLTKGERLMVPARRWHWFEGDPSADEPMAMDVYFDKSKAKMEERFFRNVLTYLADCRREDMEPSIFQLLMIFYQFEMVPGLRIVPWERLNLALNTAIMLFGNFVGLLLGYKASYSEYYQPHKKTE